MRNTSNIAKTFVALVALAGFTTFGVLSLFTDSDDIGANAFTTGTVDLQTSPTSALVTFSGMAPGDKVTNSIVMTNGGGLGLRYAISSTATNTDIKGLKDQLVLEIKTIDVTVPGTPCDVFDGASLYEGDLDSTAGLLVGDATAGADTGDRTLAAAGAETLCFRLSLPIGTGDAFQDAATTAVFTFAAEQTLNN